jgi:dihydroorotate dehydrogenase electron transfer subunit
MPYNGTATVTRNKRIAEDIYEMTLCCPDADLSGFVPGQFAQVEIPAHAELILKRPLSIHAVDAKKYTVTLIYQVRGKGTHALAAVPEGTGLQAILPLGHGFDLTPEHKTVFLVGGGMGIAPLAAIIKRWPDRRYVALLGYRCESAAYCGSVFSGCDMLTASEDGSIGEQGLVTALVETALEKINPDIVLACGPAPMLRALKGFLSPRGIRAQFSMEERMGCGFGACAVCACAVQTAEGLDYKKACIDGPVFDMDEVII